jgi:hypothetical protein
MACAVLEPGLLIPVYTDGDGATAKFAGIAGLGMGPQGNIL